MIRAGLALAAATAATIGAFRAGPPPAHTGAFGEPDCAVCHFDAIRDDEGGTLVIEATETYVPGMSYEITIRLRHPELAIGGFQLTARFLEGEREGRQAGTLEAVDERTRVQRGGGGVLYASHSADGVAPAPDREGEHPDAPDAVQWTVLWRAPGSVAPVAFDVAAQASDDDDSMMGERLYRVRHIARPAAEK